MRKYGVYKDSHGEPIPYDVAATQDILPSGQRIRNKKAKRRRHNKIARSQAKAEIRKEQNESHA